jgi:NAD(P)-dependent dehydrogenase (short-subunit alcohol dehydrogenase family)
MSTGSDAPARATSDHASAGLARIVVVTGAASGIGEACARRFAAAGDRVVVADRNLDGAQRVAAALGARGTALHIDLGDEHSIERAAREVAESMGTAHVLVNCAGVLQRTLPPEQLSLKEWDIVSRIDLRGTYLSCVAFGAPMAARGQGAIVNIASVAGMRSGPLHAYGPAKAGVISVGECLAAEWGPRGVRVNTVSPGWTLTPALDKGMATGTLDEGHMVASTALGRLVKADEIAAAVQFLASEQASAITGVNLPVDAGFIVATPWAGYGGLRQA